jgi:hypothetical protein
VEAFAAIALEQGFDTHLIRQLAGGSVPQHGDARDHLRAALGELGVPVLAGTEAARCLAQALAGELLARRIDPFHAARQLAVVSRAVGPGFHDLDPFIYAESEAEDRPTDREFFARAILDEAQRWNDTGKGSV